jgi:hypothetical protein
MMRYLKLLFLGMLISGLMAGSAFAGICASNLSTVSLEAMNAPRNVVLSGVGGDNAGTASFGITTGASLTALELMTVTWTNAAFTGAPYRWCASNGGVTDFLVTDVVSPTAGSVSWNFTLNGNATTWLGAAGNFLYMSNNACGAAAAANLSLRFPAGCTARNATGEVAISAFGPVDSCPATRVASILPEYGVRVPFNIFNQYTQYTINYLYPRANDPANGTMLLIAGPPGVPGTGSLNGFGPDSVRITRTDHTYNTNIGTQNAGLTVRALVTALDSSNWQGVTRVWLQAPGAFCNLATNVGANTGPAINPIAINIPAVNFNGNAAADFDLCVLVNGTTTLAARTISESVDVTVDGAGACDPAAFPQYIDEIWNVNAYQAQIPWVVNAGGAFTGLAPSTYCLFNNLDNKEANVLLDINSSELAVTLVGLSLGTIPAATSRVLLFSNNQACLYDANNNCLPPGPVNLTSLGPNARYNAQVTVATYPQSVDGTCIQTDPSTGVKRSVPLLTGNYLYGLFPMPAKQ